MAGWNFADVWETIAEAQPDAPVFVFGERKISWGEFDWRADGVAQALLAAGLQQQDKVAMYLYNCPEYMETAFAAAKVGLVPVNTNYRYREDELVYLWDNADVRAVVFHGAFAERIEELQDRVPFIQTWFWVDDGTGPCPDWARPYEGVVPQRSLSEGGRTPAPWGRSGDDIFMIYTGGTTGIPKGVMWRQDDFYLGYNTSSDPVQADMDFVRERLPSSSTAVVLPAPPLMHGTGFLVSLNCLSQGGCVVLLTSRSFSAEELLDAVQEHKVNWLALVGDAFGRPIVKALDEQKGRWDISSLGLVVSSGVMWSEPVKKGLLRHHPGMLLADLLGSTEALGMGQSVSGSAGSAETANFRLGENATVIREDGSSVTPGSGEVGMIAVRGYMPIGYYKDPEKTGRTFREINGERWSIPGDYATVDIDDRIQLLGRGSVCINTGGEKVFPEEVEEVLKEHEAVQDTVVVGVPDDRFGQAICAVVELLPGKTVEEEELIATVKEHLAGYKAPRHVRIVSSVGRSPNGKADYGRVRQESLDALGLSS